MLGLLHSWAKNCISAPCGVVLSVTEEAISLHVLFLAFGCRSVSHHRGFGPVSCVPNLPLAKPGVSAAVWGRRQPDEDPSSRVSFFRHMLGIVRRKRKERTEELPIVKTPTIHSAHPAWLWPIDPTFPVVVCSSIPGAIGFPHSNVLCGAPCETLLQNCDLQCSANLPVDRPNTLRHLAPSEPPGIH